MSAKRVRLRQDGGSAVRIAVIGGGLAGSEAAWQAARGLGEKGSVDLYEMRPDATTAAHQSGYLAELVCSNSLKSESVETPTGLLKENLFQLDSLLIKLAREHTVPAGKALAVDRESFGAAVTKAIEGAVNIRLIREKLTSVPSGYDRIIIATGPLTSEGMAAELARLAGSDRLYFYDAIAPIIETDSVDMAIAFWQDRYDDPGSGDYLNLPMSEAEYHAFVDALLAGAVVPYHDFEEATFFEGCMPIEEIARRGKESLSFGPFKPVGLTDPNRGEERTHAVAQLRKETRSGDAMNLVGFQTKLTYPEQERIFRMLPGMKDVVFLRHGSLHRNTYINGPEALQGDLSFKSAPHVKLAGQISGVEGYVESIAIGWLAGSFAAAELLGQPMTPPPPPTTLGALLNYVTEKRDNDYQPTNLNFSLFPPLDKKPRRRKERRLATLERAQEALEAWREPA